MPHKGHKTRLEQHFKIEPPPMETWSQEAWARKAMLQEESKRRRAVADAKYARFTKAQLAALNRITTKECSARD